MVERSRDSSRDLLEELEDGWGTPRPAGAQATATAATAAQPAMRTDARADDVPASSESGPDLAALDEGWLDDLFPGEEDEKDDEDEDEPEPELPDERLDPEAYAIAKEARE